MSFMTAEDFASAQCVSHPNTAVRKIAGEVSAATGVAVAAIYGPERTARSCRARDLVCYIAYRQGFSFPEIGRALARHHTTIMNAVQNERARRGEAHA